MRPDQSDSYRTEIDATVLRVQRDGDGAWIALDRSVFYPTSGGQPHDVGELHHEDGTARVVEVTAAGPDAVLHRATGPVPAEGTRVHAAIDWDVRYRHMQRHSAQHLLSQAFLHVSAAYETRSVSLTSADATLDLAGDPDDEAVAAAFERARAWAYAALPIDAFEVDEAELARYPLRRPPKVSGRIRLVRMGEVELSACGGTHLRTTSEMLPLLALGRQRIRGGLARVTFRAGLEAGELAQRTLSLTGELARSFSSRVGELPARVEGLREEARAAAHRAERERARWARLRAEAARDEARALRGRPLLRIVSDGAEALPALAEACAEVAPDGVALLAARDQDRVTLLFRRPSDAEWDEVGDGGTAPDLRIALRAALPHLDGRGGGRPDRVQGAGPAVGGAEAALEAATAALGEALTEVPAADRAHNSE